MPTIKNSIGHNARSNLRMDSPLEKNIRKRLLQPKPNWDHDLGMLVQGNNELNSYMRRTEDMTITRENVIDAIVEGEFTHAVRQLAASRGMRGRGGTSFRRQAKKRIKTQGKEAAKDVGRVAAGVAGGAVAGAISGANYGMQGGAAYSQYKTKRISNVAGKAIEKLPSHTSSSPRVPKGVAHLKTREAVKAWAANPKNVKRTPMGYLQRGVLSLTTGDMVPKKKNREGFKGSNAMFLPAATSKGTPAVVAPRDTPSHIMRHEVGHAKDFAGKTSRQVSKSYNKSPKATVKAELRAWRNAGVSPADPVKKVAIGVYKEAGRNKKRMVQGAKIGAKVGAVGGALVGANIGVRSAIERREVVKNKPQKPWGEGTMTRENLVAAIVKKEELIDAILEVTISNTGGSVSASGGRGSLGGGFGTKGSANTRFGGGSGGGNSAVMGGNRGGTSGAGKLGGGFGSKGNSPSRFATKTSGGRMGGGDSRNVGQSSPGSTRPGQRNSPARPSPAPTPAGMTGRGGSGGSSVYGGNRQYSGSSNSRYGNRGTRPSSGGNRGTQRSYTGSSNPTNNRSEWWKR
jgi:hypothetical protein